MRFVRETHSIEVVMACKANRSASAGQNAGRMRFWKRLNFSRQLKLRKGSSSSSNGPTSSLQGTLQFSLKDTWMWLPWCHIFRTNQHRFETPERITVWVQPAEKKHCANVTAEKNWKPTCGHLERQQQRQNLAKPAAKVRTLLFPAKIYVTHFRF